MKSSKSIVRSILIWFREYWNRCNSSATSHALNKLYIKISIIGVLVTLTFAVATVFLTVKYGENIEVLKRLEEQNSILYQQLKIRETDDSITRLANLIKLKRIFELVQGSYMGYDSSKLSDMNDSWKIQFLQRISNYLEKGFDNKALFEDYRSLKTWCDLYKHIGTSTFVISSSSSQWMNLNENETKELKASTFKTIVEELYLFHDTIYQRMVKDKGMEHY